MKSILVIDDNEVILDAVSRGLKAYSTDWEVLKAENGREAIEILNSVPVDFAVTDVAMPVMDGYQFLEYCGKFFPSLPVAAMTADYSPEAEDKLRSLNVREIMRKPFSIKSLFERIGDELCGMAAREHKRPAA